jgi:hypothetical protein
MVDLSLIQPASQVAAALGVCIAAIYYVMTLRVQQANMKNTLETRQAQLFMQIYQRSQETEFTTQYGILMSREWKDAADFMSKYKVLEPAQDGASLLSLQTYFEGIGVLLMKKMIDIDLVYELMATRALGSKRSVNRICLT